MYYVFESDKLARITPFLEAMPEGALSKIMKLEHGEYFGVIRLAHRDEKLDAVIPKDYETARSADGKFAAATFDNYNLHSMHDYISVGDLPYIPTLFSLYTKLIG